MGAPLLFGGSTSPMVILPFMMFSGFFLNPESAPTWLMWIEFLSPMKYAFSALAQNEFTNLTLHCTPSQTRLVAVSQLGTPVRICPIETGEAYLDNLNVQPFLTIPNCQWLLAVETARRTGRNTHRSATSGR